MVRNKRLKKINYSYTISCVCTLCLVLCQQITENYHFSMQIFASDNKLEISAVAVWLILYKTSQLNISPFFHTPNFRSPVTYFYFLQKLKAHICLMCANYLWLLKGAKKLTPTYYYILLYSLPKLFHL